MRQATILLLLAAAFCLLTGCAAQKPSRFSITPEQYDAAFNIARDELRDRHFDLARVDARAGIITTQASASAGLATPWIDHTDTLADSTESAAQRERRRVEVRFIPAGTSSESAEPAPENPELDIRSQPGPYDVAVRVIIERVYQPGRRIDATSVRLSSFSQDPELVARGEQPAYAVEHREDPRLAGRIAHAIETSVRKIVPALPLSGVETAYDPLQK